MKLKRAYKVEINPTSAQKQLIHQTIGTCRFLYNRYIAKNKELYEIYLSEKERLEGLGYSKDNMKEMLPSSFMSGMEFDKYINNDLSKQEGFRWIKSCGSKARKQSIMNGDKAFKEFFKGGKGFPRFKKKNDQDVKAYFPKNNKGDWQFERHRIKVPTIGWVKLKEFGYLPKGAKISSGTISQKADRYYVSVLVEVEDTPKTKNLSRVGIGIDLGLKDFVVSSDGHVFHNINKAKHVRKLEKQLKQAQRSLSRKYESLKKRKTKGGTVTTSNIRKQVLRVQRLNRRLTAIREAYRMEVINSLVKAKPSYVTLEKLNVKGMMKNRHLSEAIQKQGFYDFKERLIKQCLKYNIEVREVSQWYPSSKTCHQCGEIKRDLKLKDRRFYCPCCGYEADRDLNAALNLRDATEYIVLT